MTNYWALSPSICVGRWTTIEIFTEGHRGLHFVLMKAG